MKIQEIIIRTFKKGSIYQPDDVENVPKEFSGEYFDSPDYLQVKYGEYEYGSVVCKKTLKIKIIIYSNKSK